MSSQLLQLSRKMLQHSFALKLQKCSTDMGVE